MSKDEILTIDIFKKLMTCAFNGHDEVIKNYLDEHNKMTMDIDKAQTEAVVRVREKLKNIEDRLFYIEAYLDI